MSAEKFKKLEESLQALLQSNEEIKRLVELNNVKIKNFFSEMMAEESSDSEPQKSSVG